MIDPSANGQIPESTETQRETENMRTPLIVRLVIVALLLVGCVWWFAIGARAVVWLLGALAP